MGWRLADRRKSTAFIQANPYELIPFTAEGGRLIRRQWHNGAWYISVVVVALLAETSQPSACARQSFQARRKGASNDARGRTATICLHTRS